MAKKQVTGPVTVSVGDTVLGEVASWEFSGSGFIGFPVSGIDCEQCGRNMGYTGHPDETYVRVEHNPQTRYEPGSDHYRNFTLCPKCAGYQPDQQRFKTLEDYIRESLPPGLKDMPSLVLADYLEENGASAAEWIRNHTSGG